MSGRLALHAPARARRSSGAGVWWWKRAADQSKRERASTRHTARKDRVNTVKERACARGILPPPHLGLTHRLLPLAIRISPWHWRPRCVPPLGSPRILLTSIVLFLLDFSPQSPESTRKPAVDHSGRPRVDRRSTRGGAALELDLGLPDSPQAGRGFVVGQRAVKPLLLVWNRCFSVLLASEVPSQAAHGAMPADPTRGSIGSTKTMSGARFCEHRVWVSCCILARSMRAHANDSQCCC